jgi:16S rRNA (guanine966-N2)-methyltransferase
MRVIAGALGGRRLHTPKGDLFRPTTDQVREAVFNILATRVRWTGAHVCDLFAGSGGIGIEALSRGAQHATFVDNDRASLAVLRGNIDALALRDRCTVVTAAAERFLARCQERYQVIFADPPYAYTGAADLLGMAARQRVLAPGGWFCFEHAATATPPSPDAWRLADARRYGRTTVTFYQHTDDTTEENPA